MIHANIKHASIQALYLPIDGADAGDVVLRADALGEEPVADLPGEHGRVLPLVLRDGVHHVRRGHLGLAAADHPGAEGPGFVIS